MILHHFTSYQNWKNIKKSGLKPYSINHPELNAHFPDGIEAIWSWNRKLSGLSKMGTIIYQSATKQAGTVVELSYNIEIQDLIHYGNKLVITSHSGVIGSFQYHDDESAVLVSRKIEPDEITLVREYNLVELLS